MSFPAVDDVALMPGLGAFSLGSTLGHVLGSSRRDVLVGVFLVPEQSSPTGMGEAEKMAQARAEAGRATWLLRSRGWEL